jgi:hypothetical protein
VLNLSAWLISHGIVFFSRNKLANSTFQLGFSVKQTAPYEHVSSDTLVYLKSFKWYCSCWIMYQECIMCIHSFRDSRSPSTLKISSSENRCYIKLQVTWFFVHAWSWDSNLWPQMKRPWFPRRESTETKCKMTKHSVNLPKYQWYIKSCTNIRVQ